jgi:aspartate/methionine/tyrosine aminotransferase
LNVCGTEDLFRCDSDFVNQKIQIRAVRAKVFVKLGIARRQYEGASYIFANSTGLNGKKATDSSIIESDTAFAEYLLRAVGVAVVRGSAFGLAPYFLRNVGCRTHRGLSAHRDGIRTTTPGQRTDAEAPGGIEPIMLHRDAVSVGG